MAKKRFWPGFRWRILAHRRDGKRATMSTDSFDLRSGMDATEYGTHRQILGGDWEFDELVIDDWFHLEQMDTRHWWIGIGKDDDYWHVHVHVDAEGVATVRVEKQ